MSKKDNILKWLGFAKLLLPTALISAGVDPSKVHGLTEAITGAETQFGPGSGKEKLDAVVKGVIGGMETKGVAPATIAATKKTLEDGVTSAVQLVNDVHALHLAAQPAESTAVTTTTTTTTTETTPPPDPASGD